MNELKQLSNKVQAIDSAQKVIENQLAQAASNVPRPLGALPGQPEENPKGQISTVTLRNGKRAQQPEVEPMQSQYAMKDVPPTSTPSADQPSSSNSKGENEEPYVPPPPYVPPLPFPQKKNQVPMESKYGKFLDILKNYTSPFLLQMQSGRCPLTPSS